MENVIKFRLSEAPGNLGLQCDRDGLALAGVQLLWRDNGIFRPRPPNEIRFLLSRAYNAEIGGENRVPGIGAVARALNEGDLMRAMIAAVFLRLPELDWAAAARLAVAEDRLTKGGFNPDEPRDEYGRWTAGGDGTEDATASTSGGVGEDQVAVEPVAWDPDDLDDIDYQGYYHDQVVKDLAEDFRRGGNVVVTEVSLTGINGVTARADMLVLSSDKTRLGLMEVKTGLNPDFTDKQKLVYPLAAIAGHVTSFDRKVVQLGLVPGAPFPAMIVREYYKRGPGYAAVIRPYP